MKNDIKILLNCHICVTVNFASINKSPANTFGRGLSRARYRGWDYCEHRFPKAKRETLFLLKFQYSNIH